MLTRLPTACIAAVAACLALALPGSGARLPGALATAKNFPVPPAGSVVYSREDQSDDLALAVAPRGSHTLVQVSVLDNQGAGASHLSVQLTVRGATRRAVACGAGCYRAEFATARPVAVGVKVRGPGATTDWHVVLPTTWPAIDGTQLVAGAEQAWRALHSLTFVDRLSGGPGQRVVSYWRIVAPDRVAYSIPHGSAAVIIGNRRWDRPGSGKWIQGVQNPALTQPVPFWVDVTDAHVLGESVFHGHAVWRVSFFDPGTPGWFDVLLDKQTLHTLDLHMIATAHFMHDTYSNFDHKVQIEPPPA